MNCWPRGTNTSRCFSCNTVIFHIYIYIYFLDNTKFSCFKLSSLTRRGTSLSHVPACSTRLAIPRLSEVLICSDFASSNIHAWKIPIKCHPEEYPTTIRQSVYLYPSCYLRVALTKLKVWTITGGGLMQGKRGLFGSSSKVGMRDRFSLRKKTTSPLWLIVDFHHMQDPR